MEVCAVLARQQFVEIDALQLLHLNLLVDRRYQAP
jgi:hypothetical protein